MKRIHFHVTVLAFFLGNVLHAQTITTIAGTGVAGYNGDDKAATIAQLYQPAGIMVDKNGNIFTADFLNSRIRKINSNGFISTFAGTGVAAFNGDNIQVTSASVNMPENVVKDTAGNIFILDTYNHRIRKVLPNGTISTVAGTGSYGFNGDNISALNANISYPSDGILVDQMGNIYFSDSYVHRIRKIDVYGIITTIAGTGVAGYNGDNIAANTAMINTPYALAMDIAGNLYFADGFNHRVRKISPSGIITTVAGTGVAGYNGNNIVATTATLNRPIGLLIDGAGNLVITDGVNNRIRKVGSNGLITTIAGTGNASYNGDNIPATLATLNYPNGLAMDSSGNLLIADLGNHRIRKITNAAIILPLSITKFTAQLQNGSGLLQWQTRNEVNTKTFVIEVSLDGHNFSPLDSITARNISGNNTYSYLDAGLSKGIRYYRLKSVDRDEKVSFSNIASLRFGNDFLTLNFAPNPVKDVANLTFSSVDVKKYTIKITDVNGRVIHQISGTTTIGLNNLTLELGRLTSGTYFTTIIVANKVTGQTKFTKD